MNEMFPLTTRRTLLQRGLVFIAGALGLPLAMPEARSEPALPDPSPPPAPQTGKTLHFYARRLQVHCPSMNSGELPGWGGRLQSHGDLLDQPNGAKVGQFSATCFAPQSHFGSVGANHTVELQTLKLSEGTLFGMGCAGPAAEGERAHAIVGGTGSFTGARGSYVIRQSSSGRGEANVEFLITLVS